MEHSIDDIKHRYINIIKEENVELDTNSKLVASKIVEAFDNLCKSYGYTHIYEDGKIEFIVRDNTIDSYILKSIEKHNMYLNSYIRNMIQDIYHFSWIDVGTGVIADTLTAVIFLLI